MRYVAYAPARNAPTPKAPISSRGWPSPSHSGTHLTITLSTGDGNLHAVVTDDGRGFDLDEAIVRARVTNHLGLEALIERIDAAGGSIEFDTAPGKGTTVRLSLPVRPS